MRRMLSLRVFDEDLVDPQAGKLKRDGQPAGGQPAGGDETPLVEEEGAMNE